MSGVEEVLAGEHMVYLGDAYGTHPVAVSDQLAGHLADLIAPLLQQAREEGAREALGAAGEPEGEVFPVYRHWPDKTSAEAHKAELDEQMPWVGAEVVEVEG